MIITNWHMNRGLWTRLSSSDLRFLLNSLTQNFDVGLSNLENNMAAKEVPTASHSPFVPTVGHQGSNWSEPPSPNLHPIH